MTVLAPLVWRPSPNHSSRNGTPISHLVWHATAGHYLPSIQWLDTRTIYDRAGNVKSGPDASCHAMIREDGGEVAQLVALHEKAWHVYPYWNLRSVGIEHASTGAGFASHAQMLESARLFAWLCHELDIPPVHGVHRPRGIVRHRDIGAAGGNHSDGPTDSVWFGDYLPAVQRELARGGFRKVYLR